MPSREKSPLNERREVMDRGATRIKVESREHFQAVIVLTERLTYQYRSFIICLSKAACQALRRLV